MKKKERCNAPHDGATGKRPFARPANQVLKPITTISASRLAGHSHPLRCAWLLLLLATFLQPWKATAHTAESIQALTVTNYTGWLIEADGLSDAQNSGAGYDRDAIRVRAQVQYSTGGGLPVGFEYQLAFRLLDTAGAPVPLVQTNGTTNTTFSLFDTVTLPFFGQNSSTRNYYPALNPAIRLDPYNSYRVELVLFERPGASSGRFNATGDERLDSFRSYLHFTNTNNNDSAVNVIAKLNGAGFSRSYAVKTVPGKKSFQASIGYSLTRYDRFLSAINSSNVVVHLNYQLVDVLSSNTVPLVTNKLIVTSSLNSYVSASPKTPAVGSFPATLDLEPAPGIQLNSVDGLYRVDVTISHVEVPGQTPVEGNDFFTTNQRLLHFNGRLSFGNVETEFTSIDNVPNAGVVVPATHVTSSLGVDNNSGFLVGFPNHKYGNGTDLPVNLLVNGNSVFNGGAVNVLSPVPDKGTNARVRFQRSNLVLDTLGARSTVLATLPSGFGYRLNLESRIINGKVSWPNVRLTPQLIPANDLTYSTPHYACEETKPFWIRSSSMLWQIDAGRFILTPVGPLTYVRAQELEDLEAAPGLPHPWMKFKRSNEQYHRFVQNVETPEVIVNAAADFSARMVLEVSFGPGEFITHFPYDSQISWSGNGAMGIVNDLVVPTNSYLSGANTITNRYDQDCPGCGPGKGRTNLNLVLGGNLSFTRDGGLTGSGDLQTAKPLNWGWINEPSILKYAQRTTPFSQANFLMSGCFLRGDQTSLERNDGPGVLLFTGTATTNLHYLERPGTAEYFEGLADYAGLNFRVALDGAAEAESVLGGKASGLYDLTGRSKYYTRWSGVSGIHEAVLGTFPTNLVIYGYPFTFNNYGLSYLSSENEDSTTEGSVHVRHPSNFDQNFKELKFSCVGALEDAKVPGNESKLFKLLEYWNGDFITKAINFDRKDGLECNPGLGYLVLGVQAHATYVEQPLYGSLGFKTNGNFVTALDVSSGEILLDDGFNSRLKLPNNFRIHGPTTNESYTLNPVTDAFYNDWQNRQNADQGYVNIPAEMDVPFFENLKVHVHTSAKTNSPGALIYLMGGWPNHGYKDANGKHYFNQAKADPDNTGFPTNDGEDIYRNSPVEDYHPRAQTEWLGIVDFDYPLQWSSTLRAFQSWEPITTELLVIETEHKVKYMAPKSLELLFGVKADSAPYLNLASMTFNAIDNTHGVLQAFLDAGLTNQQFYINRGFESLNAMLRTDMREFFDDPLLYSVQQSINNCYDELKLWRASGTNVFNAMKAGVISNYFSPNNGVILQKLRLLDTTTNGLNDQLQADISNAIDAIDAAQTVLGETDSKRTVASQLMKEILNNVDQDLAEFVIDEVAGGSIDDFFNEYLQQYDVSLDTVNSQLAAMKNVLWGVKTNLDAGGQFAAELDELLDTHDSVLQSVMAQVQQDVLARINGISPANNPFDEMDPTGIRAYLRQKLEDRFFATDLAAALHTSIKQRLYDVDAAVREATDTGFGVVNTALRTAVSEVVAKADTELKKLAGKVGLSMAAGEINGYAHINGDSLKTLRLDAKAEWQLTSPMNFSCYFQIRELDSDGTPTECLPESGRATEVTLGASGPISFIQSNLTATINAKFTFEPSGNGSAGGLVNVGGSIAIGGELSFANVKVKDIYAGMAIGEVENYITAAARVLVNGYQGAGGFFFGKTCTLGVMSWDREVNEVLGSSLPYTGFYLYGEAWIPISEVVFGIPYSCLFQVSGGVGLGVGMFAEGPTFIGKGMLGLSGDVLCAVGIDASIKLVAIPSPESIRAQGRANIDVEILFITIPIEISISYLDGEWDASF